MKFEDRPLVLPSSNTSNPHLGKGTPIYIGNPHLFPPKEQILEISPPPPPPLQAGGVGGVRTMLVLKVQIFIINLLTEYFIFSLLINIWNNYLVRNNFSFTSSFCTATKLAIHLNNRTGIYYSNLFFTFILSLIFNCLKFVCLFI